MNAYTIAGWQARPQEVPGGFAFVCGHCGVSTSVPEVWTRSQEHSQDAYRFVGVCPKCRGATYIEHSPLYGHWQSPSEPPRQDLSDLVPPEVRDLYLEAGRSNTAGAPTACVMCCRKVLMNVAVSQGAKANQTFQEFVTWLTEERWLARGQEPIADRVRRAGNTANHEIQAATHAEAREILSLTWALLNSIYPPQAASDP